MPKICNKCQRVLSDPDFYKDKSHKDGLRSTCKKCTNASHAKYVEKNRKKVNAQKREWQRKDRANLSEKRKIQQRIQWDKGRGKRLLQRAKYRAKKKGLAYDLDNYSEDIIKRVHALRCEMTGLPMRIEGTSGKEWDSPSLDRIDATKGYTHDNIRVICWGMNTALSHWGDDALEKMVRAWIDQLETLP